MVEAYVQFIPIQAYARQPTQPPTCFQVRQHEQATALDCLRGNAINPANVVGGFLLAWATGRCILADQLCRLSLCK